MPVAVTESMMLSVTEHSQLRQSPAPNAAVAPRCSGTRPSKEPATRPRDNAGNSASAKLRSHPGHLAVLPVVLDGNWAMNSGFQPAWLILGIDVGGGLGTGEVRPRTAAATASIHRLPEDLTGTGASASVSPSPRKPSSSLAPKSVTVTSS